MNPIIYACSSKEFQRAFIRILKCQFRRHPRLLMNRGPSNVSAKIVSFCKHKAEKCSITNSTRLGDIYSMKQLPDSLRVSLAVYHAHAKNDSCLSKDNVDNEGSENVSSSDNGDDNNSQYSLRRSFHNSVHKASCSNPPNIDENYHGVISFEKDENYIKAFRKRDSHGELV
ncbi:hypothetical protein ACJMK2_005048 [Sinanodonta woodiana]|uniref:Uncharacterized protein n=1 Tax=Sinanodonta woodiana TaxID=1069815 RepID=A0ABD3VQF2_SINWO